MHKNNIESKNVVGFIMFSPRHISWIIAAVLFVNSVSFLTGYLWGKKCAAEQACYTIKRDSLADTVYSAVCWQNGQLNDTDEQDVDANETSDDLDNESIVAVAENEDVVECESKIENEELESSARYFAQLVSFHTRRQADIFANKLQSNAIPVTVKERSSKTPKGRVIRWYQIVAGPYETRERVTQVAAQLQKSEKLHDVRIVQG